MRPGPETTNAFIYCLALAANKSHVSIDCVGTTGNHYHAVLLDNQGRLPEFLEAFHKLFAKHQNCLHGRWEAFWATEQTSVVELPTPEDVLAKMTYAIANPCSSHLVEKVHHWPGVESLTAIEEEVPLRHDQGRRRAPRERHQARRPQSRAPPALERQAKHPRASSSPLAARGLPEQVGTHRSPSAQ
jgi:hypothetical protein